MKTVLFHTRNFQDESIHYIFYNDPDFIEALEKRQIRFIQSRYPYSGTIDHVLFLEADSIGISPKRHGIDGLYDKISKEDLDDSVYQEYKKKLGVDRLCLMIAEGVVHKPENHSLQLSEMVNSVLTWNDDFVDGIKFHKYNWPLPLEWGDFGVVSSGREKLLVNISANKYSSATGELYSARRTAINVFEERFQDNFDLYGIGWNKAATRAQRVLNFLTPHYKSYRGSVDSKAEVLGKYRFALCYENATVAGWITEKVFDCFRSGCIPIYLGAPNIHEYIPKGAFIDRREFATDQDVADFIGRISTREIVNIQECIRDYLKSKQYQGFLTTSLAERIAVVLTGFK